MSGELLARLRAARDKDEQDMAAVLVELEARRQDVADLEYHIAVQEELERKRAAAEPPTQEIPAVPPRPGAEDATTALPVYVPNGLASPPEVDP